MEHHFTVPVPVDVAWEALLDPERVAPCMPGATLSSVEGSDFSGSVKVKLGPVTLLYKGNGTFSEVDESARRVVLDASGKDSRGNGTAAATVTATLSEDGGTTAVRVDTDLKITGKPAQLGRGLISEVGGKLINQFADCLAERLAGAETAEEPAQGTAAESVAQGSGQTQGAGQPQSSGQTQGSEPTQSSGQTQGAGEPTGAQAAEPRSASSAEQAGSAAPAAGAAAAGAAAAGAAGTSANGDRPAPETAGSAQGERSGWRVTAPSSTGSTAANNAPRHAAQEPEAIDLLDTAGAPMLRRLAPALAAAVVVFVLLRLLRRRHRNKSRNNK
ncbi:SRPBCC family protein [Bounagaea algeriensis]